LNTINHSYATFVSIQQECRHQIASETVDPQDNNRLGLTCMGQLNVDLLTPWKGYLSRWIGLIRQYSSATLTKAEDKLVAISGLAKEMQAILDIGTDLKFTYLAGLWSPYLIQQLLWRRKEHYLVRPSQYRAPSWSWASVDGVAEFSCYNWEAGQ
jgi:hypothetical protein